MARSTRRLAACAALLALALPANVSASQEVSVRVEGTAATLLPRTLIPAIGAAVVRDGNGCPGDSALAALDRATAGSWAGTWNAGFADWEVTLIAGEMHSFAASEYWGFFLNEASASLGVCGQKVQPGDRLLFAPAPSNFDPIGVLALEGVPAKVAPRAPFTVTVKRTATGYPPPDYMPVVETTPLAGAKIALPGGGEATTSADGTATVTLDSPGPTSLHAVKQGDVRSAAEPVCVTDGADGFCATVKATAPAQSGALPVTAAPDAAPALASIAALGEQQVFARGRGPRALSGSVSADASGLRDVRLRLTRTRRGACQTFDAKRERLVRSARCGTEGGLWFSVGDRAAWSYLLPFRLPAGRWVLDVRTIDGAGNVSRGANRGSDPSKPRSRVVFHVR